MKIIRQPREINPELKICYTYTLKSIFGEQLDVPVWGEWGKLEHLIQIPTLCFEYQFKFQFKDTIKLASQLL